MKTERNFNYDLIRLMGLLVIMVAHSSPPEWLFQLRNFGTPLLIVGSALTYAMIYEDRKIHTNEFYKKRLGRLVFPAWIFLSIFFFFFFLVSQILNKDFPFSMNEIIHSYNFMGGIGFIWIIKIYIILALITPAAICINRNIKSNNVYFLALLAAYFLYELSLRFISPNLSEASKEILNSIIFTAIPYSILYLYGFRLKKLKNTQVVLLSLASISIFVFLLVVKYVEVGYFVPTQKFKYPPTIYYLSYAFFALNTIYLIFNQINLKDKKVKDSILWLSSNSLWIYLWHIMGYYIWNFLLPDPDGVLLLALAKMSFLLIFAFVCTAAQNYFVNLLIKTNIPYKKRVASLLSGNA